MTLFKSKMLKGIVALGVLCLIGVVFALVPYGYWGYHAYPPNYYYPSHYYPYPNDNSINDNISDYYHSPFDNYHPPYGYGPCCGYCRCGCCWGWYR
ncbi:protein of unknown function [Methanocaldococcus lauensis]|nr:protein of unknown function [Methanocaldococcus lauensis]